MEEKDFFYDSEEYPLVFTDDVELMVKKREIPDDVCSTTTVGTNGYHGGDSGHGGRTYFCLEHESGNFSVRIDKNNTFDFNFHTLEICAGGDAELSTLINAFKWAAKRLEEQAAELAKKPKRKELSQERFNSYINEMVEMFKAKKSMRGMSDLAAKWKIRGITKDVFFASDVIKASRKIPMSFTNQLYAYALARDNKNMEIPVYVER